MCGSKPLLAMYISKPKAVFSFRVAFAEQNSTSTLNFVPALAALNECTHYEHEIRSKCAYFCRFSQIEYNEIWMSRDWSKKTGKDQNFTVNKKSTIFELSS